VVLVNHRGVKRFVLRIAREHGLPCSQVSSGVYEQAEAVLKEYLVDLAARNHKNRRIMPNLYRGAHCPTDEETTT